MRTYLAAVVTLFLCTSANVPASPSGASPGAPGLDPRVRYTINEDWSFAFGQDSAARVNLPHTWNLEDALAEQTEYRRGIGWYRKALKLSPELRGKRIFLYFEGANQVADVFINGDSVGRHVGGYTAFAFDITDRIRLDTTNALAVRVDNRHHADIPPLNADFTFYGGIYRSVWIVATDPVHITLLDHGSSGIYIDTPELSAAGSRVRVRGILVNESGAARRVQVVSRILDQHGNEVATLRSAHPLAAAKSANFTQISQRIARPRLWSPAQPNLYRVVTEIIDGERILDRVTNPLGFRWFGVDGQRGLTLNGQPIKLYGTNRHQDRAGYGNAMPDALHEEDVRLVKAAGFNFLRLAHYPQAEAVLASADRLGLAVWEEIPVVNIITMSPEFAANAERMLSEMIRQHYNHPSVLFWGYMNEVLLVKPRPMPEGYVAAVAALARRLEQRLKTEDSTRLSVMAISFTEIDDGSGMQDVSDILGLNLYFGWYYRTLEGFGPYLDSLHARNPNRPIIISEYGADSDERIHTRAPRAFDFSTEHQQRFHESQFAQMQARSYLTGTAVWNQFDFGSKFRHDSKPNLNQKGLYYYDRSPKDVLSYYRAKLLGDPVLHIATRDWSIRAGSGADDHKQPVVVYSNLDEVELFAGTTSLGAKQIQNALATWTVPLSNGATELIARGKRGGVVIEDRAVVTYHDRSALFSDKTGEVRVFAVNTGSHYQYVDATGLVWEADRAYERGGWGYVGGKALLDHHRAWGSDEDALFQATREAVESYRFDVADGDYDVRVLLTERTAVPAAARVFDVSVNGVKLFDDVDLAAECGRYTAVERTIRISARDGITVRFDATRGEPTVSGIMLRKL